MPVRISYDNTTIAVSKVMAKERELTRGFLTLESAALRWDSRLPSAPELCRPPRRPPGREALHPQAAGAVHPTGSA